MSKSSIPTEVIGVTGFDSLGWADGCKVVIADGFVGLVVVVIGLIKAKINTIRRFPPAQHEAAIMFLCNFDMDDICCSN
jgi:hypothetical protein